ncbi:MAG: hypothetical protein O2887_11160 [Bacteroidetes bacterium]|nr:hypothetical protein [Bacteroidota bacterium]
MKAYKLKSIMIGLDQSDMDKDIVRAAGYICNIVDTSNIYFVNVIRISPYPMTCYWNFRVCLKRVSLYEKRPCMMLLRHILDARKNQNFILLSRKDNALRF